MFAWMNTFKLYVKHYLLTVLGIETKVRNEVRGTKNMPSLQIGHMQFESFWRDKEKWFSLEKRRQKALSDKNSSWNFV